MSSPAGAPIQAASLDVPAPVTETMRHAEARDARLGGEFVATTAQLTVAAWATAVDGDDTTLAAMGPPDAVYRLMHPVRKPWRVAAGPRVTKIRDLGTWR
jgi:hypothetical protein